MLAIADQTESLQVNCCYTPKGNILVHSQQPFHRTMARPQVTWST